MIKETMFSDAALMAGQAGINRTVALYGDPAVHAQRVIDGYNLVLHHAGVVEGATITQQTFAAMELQRLAMGMLSAKDTAAAGVIATGIAQLAILAQQLGLPRAEPDAAEVPDPTARFSPAAPGQAPKLGSVGAAMISDAVRAEAERENEAREALQREQRRRA